MVEFAKHEKWTGSRGVDPYVWNRGDVPAITGDIHGNYVPPNILEVMSFRMSTWVTATVVCCILTQMCSFTKKLQLRPPDPLYRGSNPGPRWGTSIPRPPVFFYVPPIILWDRRPWAAHVNKYKNMHRQFINATVHRSIDTCDTHSFIIV